MQSAAYADFLSDTMEFLSLDPASSEIIALDALRAALAAGGKRQVAKTLAALGATEHESTDVFGSAIGSATEPLRRLAKFADAHAKKATAGDTLKLVEFVEAHPNFAVDSLSIVAERVFAETARPANSNKSKSTGALAQLIDNYLGRLDETFGFEPDFNKVFDELQSDAGMKAPQLKRLAKLFTKMTAKSADDALQLIYQKHHTIASADQHKKTVGSRIAG